MKFTIMSKGDQSSDALASTMKEYLLDFGFIMDEQEPDIVISVGGDGTLLYAFHRYYNRLMKQHLLVYIQAFRFLCRLVTDRSREISNCNC